MKKMKVVSLLAVIVLFAGLGCTKQNLSNEPVVATTVVALTSVSKNLLDSTVDVQSILPKGAEPHDVILSTRELQNLQRARAIVTLGLKLDDWTAQGVSATGVKAPIIVASKFLNLPPESDNPHVWLSPKRMMVMSRGMADEFKKIFPESAAKIESNVNAYEVKLEMLDGEYRALGALKNRDIVTLHDAFGYLAQDYNLNVVAVIKDLPEDNPSPDDIARVISVLNKYPKAALFGESEISPSILETIAHDTGRTIYTLDPLEIGEPDAATYIMVMKKNLSVLKAALGAK